MMEDWTRRELIGAGVRAGGAAFAVSLSPAALSAGRILGANDRVRVGLIGSGGQGRTDLATFLVNKEVDCPIVCDVDDRQAARAQVMVEEIRGSKPDMVRDFRRVLDRKDLDAVIVATPDHWHALPTVMACQAGLDVYVEKPLATSIAEGRAMVRAMREHKRVVQMGTQWRSSEHCARAVEFIQSGALGKIRFVRCWAYHDWLGGIGNPPDEKPPADADYDMWLGPARLRPFNPNRFHFNFRWFWDYAGGLMTDWGVHLINVVLWAMGMEPPKSVSSSGGKYVLDDNSETPDTQIAVYDFPHYALIWEHQVQCGVGMNNRPWGMWFSGTEGTLILDDGGWEVISEPKKETVKSARYPGSPDARPAHVRNFLDCMRSRQDPVEHLERGHFVSTVAHLGNLALRSNARILWDPRNEKVVNDRKADELVGVRYRSPWRLPYYRR